MRFNFARKYSPIGIDLGSHAFKAIQLKKVAAGWEVATSLSLPRISPGAPVSSSEIERLAGVLDRRGFVGREVVVAVPAAYLLTSILELPARAPGVPLEQITAIEFARVHKHEANALTMASWELPAPARASKATYMLAVGAVSSHLETHIDLLESQDLNVIAIEEPYSASARGAMHLATPNTGLIAVIDLGWDAGRLMIIKANKVVYTRKLADAGLGRLYQLANEAVSGAADLVEHGIWQLGFVNSPQPDVDHIDVLDALASHYSAVTDEVVQAFSYASHRYPDTPMSCVILIGGGALIPGIVQQFERDIGVTTLLPPSTNNIAAGLASALGLALWSEAI